MGVQFILFMGIDVGIAPAVAAPERAVAATAGRAALAGHAAGQPRGQRGDDLGIDSARAVQVRPRAFLAFTFKAASPAFWESAPPSRLMTAAFGLLIAALGKTAGSHPGLSVIATLIMVMLGGAWVPTFIFPQWLQKITVWSPRAGPSTASTR